MAKDSGQAGHCFITRVRKQVTSTSQEGAWGRGLAGQRWGKRALQRAERQGRWDWVSRAEGLESSKPVGPGERQREGNGLKGPQGLPPCPHGGSESLASLDAHLLGTPSLPCDCPSLKPSRELGGWQGSRGWEMSGNARDKDAYMALTLPLQHNMPVSDLGKEQEGNQGPGECPCGEATEPALLPQAPGRA